MDRDGELLLVPGWCLPEVQGPRSRILCSCLAYASKEGAAVLGT